MPPPASGVPFENRIDLPAKDIAVKWNDISSDVSLSSTLEFLGRKNVIYDQAITLLAAHAKTGKTTLLFHLIREWQQTCSPIPKVLWISEESKDVWSYRKQRSGFDVMPISVVFGFEHTPEDLLVRATIDGEEDIVIIDTATALMGVDNENDNTQVTKLLKVWIHYLRKHNKTVIIVHHLRKSEGSWGTAVAGATAWRRMVDVILEVHQVEEHPERRVVHVSGRYDHPRPMMYELVNGLLVKMPTREGDGDYHVTSYGPGEAGFNKAVGYE